MNAEILPVLDEISAVLKKHDMAGLIVVANETHVDYRIEVEASWSCAKFERDGIRIRCVEEDFATKEAQRKCLESTVGMVVTFTDVLRVIQANMIQLLEIISKYVDFHGRSTRED